MIIDWEDFKYFEEQRIVREKEWERVDSMFLKRNLSGEMDLGVISKVRDYANLVEVKTFNTERNLAKAKFQLLKDFEFIRENFEITNLNGFYAYSKRDYEYKIKKLF
ncbi:MAG: hypothetical protein GWP09_02775 [Nitrospiraceae bacterium]|nr:hypothetical protein [Nitrospiraceae bacterium]